MDRDFATYYSINLLSSATIFGSTTYLRCINSSGQRPNLFEIILGLLFTPKDQTDHPVDVTARESRSDSRQPAANSIESRKAPQRHARPERIVIDGSQTNREAILSCDAEGRLQDRSGCKLKPIRIRQSAYLNNRIEQEHRAVKCRVRPMLGFKSADSARVILGGIEMIHMMRKGQAKYACHSNLSLAEQFERLAA
jgi:hypothetical protein